MAAQPVNHCRDNSAAGKAVSDHRRALVAHPSIIMPPCQIAQIVCPPQVAGVRHKAACGPRCASRTMNEPCPITAVPDLLVIGRFTRSTSVLACLLNPKPYVTKEAVREFSSAMISW
jgi:hypothetical protein